MKTRESKKILLAETDNTAELSEGPKQCNLSLGLIQQMISLVIDDTKSNFQVPPKQTFSDPTKRINCTRYLFLIIVSLNLDMKSGERISMRSSAPNQYGPTRHSLVHCLK